MADVNNVFIMMCNLLFIASVLRTEFSFKIFSRINFNGTFA